MVHFQVRYCKFVFEPEVNIVCNLQSGFLRQSTNLGDYITSENELNVLKYLTNLKKIQCNFRK